MSEEKIALVIADGEDSNDILTPAGKVLYTVHRDGDPFNTAVNVLKALGFGVVWDDGSDVEL